MYIFLLLLVGVAAPKCAADSFELEERIVGGSDIDITQAPYQAAVVYPNSYFCGGAIVSKDIVLTAAHCVFNVTASSLYVRVGSTFLDREGQIVKVGAVSYNHSFDNKQLDADIAVLWLKQSLNFSDTVQAIEMADETDVIEDGALTKVTGWGSSQEHGTLPEYLQMAEIPKVNDKQCVDTFSRVINITERMICGGMPEGGKDACQGDSGGPMVYNNKLHGIISFGYGCGKPKYPGVYSRISALRSWIDNEIKRIRKINEVKNLDNVLIKKQTPN